MLQDAHAHLQDSASKKILADARSSGIRRIFCNSARPSDWANVKGLAMGAGEVVPFFGIHPWYVDEADAGWEERLKGFLYDNPSGVGEIGLDRSVAEADDDRQIRIFRTQMEIAADMGRPACIHCVRAWDILFHIMKECHGSLPVFMVHSFSGSFEVLRGVLDNGGYISVSSRSVGRSPDKVRKLLSVLPPERLLLETDHPYAGDRSEEQKGHSDLICMLYDKVAGMMEIEREELELRVWENGSVFTNGIIDR